MAHAVDKGDMRWLHEAQARAHEVAHVQLQGTEEVSFCIEKEYTPSFYSLREPKKTGC